MNSDAEGLQAYLLSKGVQEDLVQDAIVAYLEHPIAIRYPRAWAWKHIKWAKINSIRHAQVIQAGSHYLPETTVIRPEASPLREAQAQQALQRARKGRRSRSQIILELFALGWTYKELAQRFSLAEGSISSHLNLARRRIKRNA